jgi:hypothetical protein
MKNYALLAVFTLFFLNILSAQPKAGAATSNLTIGRIYGKIVDATTDKSVPFASVTIYRVIGQRDSLIGGGLTEENGDFDVRNLPLGPVKVKVSFTGYKSWSKNIRLAPPEVEQDLGDLRLELDAKLLGAVDITAEKVSTQLSLEKRVFNVDKNLATAGGTAEDIMKNVPSVTVDLDGNALLRNNSATIYMDGKPTLLALNQIPADQIESVEVISNPSAKYEAATKGGILNIVLKKNRKYGYNGVIGGSIGTATGNRYSGLFSGSLYEGKWNISGFYSYNANASPVTSYADRTNYVYGTNTIKTFFNQNTVSLFDNQFQLGRLGADYAVNNRNTLTLTGTITTGGFNIQSEQPYRYFLNQTADDSTGIRTTASKNSFRNYLAEMQWKKTFAKKDKSLLAFVNYSWANILNRSDWNTNGFDRVGAALKNYPQLTQSDGDGTTQQLIAQLDYVNPINDSTKVEMGVRSFYSQRDQVYTFQNLDREKNKFTTDISLSQDAIVTETINAAYITYSSKWKNNWSYQAGLRFEQSALTGKTRLGGTQDFGYSYPSSDVSDILRSLFPALYLTKKLNNGADLGINFSRKIQRPNNMQLMPSVQNADKQNIRRGNPNLQPEFLNLAELNYNKVFGANNWLSTLYGSREDNTIKPFARPDEIDPTILVTSFINGQAEWAYGWDNTLKLAFGKSFDVVLNSNLFHSDILVDTLRSSAWAWNGKANFTYRLPLGFTIQMTNSYEGNRPLPQGYRRNIYSADVSVRKAFLKGAANVTLSVSDLFDSRREILVFSQPGLFDQTSMRRRDSRFFKLAIQIPFGKPDASMFKKKPAQQQQQQSDF